LLTVQATAAGNLLCPLNKRTADVKKKKTKCQRKKGVLEPVRFFVSVTMQLNATKEAHFITGDQDPELDPTVLFCRCTVHF